MGLPKIFKLSSKISFLSASAGWLLYMIHPKMWGLASGPSKCCKAFHCIKLGPKSGDEEESIKIFLECRYTFCSCRVIFYICSFLTKPVKIEFFWEFLSFVHCTINRSRNLISKGKRKYFISWYTLIIFRKYPVPKTHKFKRYWYQLMIFSVLYCYHCNSSCFSRNYYVLGTF